MTFEPCPNRPIRNKITRSKRTHPSIKSANRRKSKPTTKRRNRSGIIKSSHLDQPHAPMINHRCACARTCHLYTSSKKTHVRAPVKVSRAGAHACDQSTPGKSHLTRVPRVKGHACMHSCMAVGGVSKVGKVAAQPQRREKAARA